MLRPSFLVSLPERNLKCMVRNNHAVIQKNANYIILISNIPVYVFLFYFRAALLSTRSQELSKSSSITNLTSLTVGDLNPSSLGIYFIFQKIMNLW